MDIERDPEQMVNPAQLSRAYRKAAQEAALLIEHEANLQREVDALQARRQFLADRVARIRKSWVEMVGADEPIGD